MRCPTGYWPSYNVPFHQKIYTLSGYEEMWMDYGEDFSYELCPRAKIFRRDQASVTDLSSLKHIMRYNGTLSECLPLYLSASVFVCRTVSVAIYVSFYCSLCGFVR